MVKLSDKSKRIGFFIIIGLVFAYLLYIIITYYASERVGMVKLSYDVDSENIMTTTYATYVMKMGEGNLKLSKDEDAQIKYPDGALTDPVVLSSTGNLVSEVEIEINYDDTNLTADENRMLLVKTDQKSGISQKCDFVLDTDKNTVTANVSGDGVWFLATSEAVK